jgi:hypothetical protein
MVGLSAQGFVVAILAVASVAVAVAVGRRVAATGFVPRPLERNPFALVAAVAGAAILVVACVAALLLSIQGQGYADYGDNIIFWIPKAESIFYAHGLDAEPLRTLVHPEYPPLVPAMNAATFHLVGGFHPSVLPFQMTLLGIAFVLSAVALLDRFSPRWITLPTLALLVTTTWFWWRLQSPLADQPVAYTIATGVLCCLVWLKELRHAWLALAVVLFAAASLTKLEGTMLALLAFLIVLAAGLLVHRRAAWPAAFLLLAPATILPWHFWLEHQGLPASAEDFDSTDLLDPGLLADRIHRFTRALKWMQESPFHQPQTAVLVCVALAVLVVAALRVPVLTATAVAWMTLGVLGLASVYWIGRFEIGFYLSVSASRVGTAIIVTGAVLMPFLLGLALERDPPDPRPRSTPSR